MRNILEEIKQYKLIEVRNHKKVLPVSEICKQLKCQENKPKDFLSVLKDKSDSKEIGLICEIKRSSPSHGIIRQDFNHIEIAKAYETAGATCISVLTDEKYFAGRNEYLTEVRAVTSLPILRKDFMVDTYQIYEARMLGADCILLIVAMLPDDKLAELEQCALDLGLSVLIEVHDEEELQRASCLKSRLLGINNRDLKTLKTDLETSLFLSEKVPTDYVLVSESGIKNSVDIELLQQAGINCFLIGEHFMRQPDITKAVQDILRLTHV
ncbi:MAG: indole-3-glycerol phosphate synthase TrpC [Alphaproteobacteria bacterium]|nr:indole-3-glycerol phosphate synthase TrpC [Alphaproteobacteria bacterium]